MVGKEITPKEKLILEALKEFADRGFDSASLNQIIKRAGISKGSFYHHFANKEELFSQVIHRAAQEKLDFVSLWIEQNGPGHENLGFFDRLRLHMAGGIEFARQRPEFSAFILSVLQNPELKSKVLALMPAYYDQSFDAAVTEALQKGELRQDLDPDLVKKVLKYTLLGLSQLILDSSDGNLNENQLKEQTDGYIDFLQRGLGAYRDG
ncbi:MAG TPA: TetR/AcrR family transcriptional regulator [Syntrophomonadaceae bacterium]|nr:TetR/AcrR family transcriptional regulator [Syntrophomonadaceae bacterium]HPU49895.1 TetR/AcrR family transcriptional regulator [Syntrophomonadaceae bacterium]